MQVSLHPLLLFLKRQPFFCFEKISKFVAIDAHHMKTPCFNVISLLNYNHDFKPEDHLIFPIDRLFPGCAASLVKSALLNPESQRMFELTTESKNQYRIPSTCGTCEFIVKILLVCSLKTFKPVGRMDLIGDLLLIARDLLTF